MLAQIMYFLFNGGKKFPMPATINDFTISREQCEPQIPVELVDLMNQMTQYEPANGHSIENVLVKLQNISELLINRLKHL